MTAINQYEEKVYSQNGEDGVISRIFDVIGVKHRTFVEFGFHERENNSKLLHERRQFGGLFIDASCKPGTRNGVHYHRAWITRDNINGIIGKYYKGPIDFLSIDVDGVDLHLLDTISAVQPRVVCIEYCASIGSDLSVTVPYKDNFDRHAEHASGMYCNASLMANIRVMKKKGYVFVASVSGLNAFFVQQSEMKAGIEPLTCKQGWQPHYARTYKVLKRFDGTKRKLSQREQYDILKDLDWVSVSAEGLIEFPTRHA